MNMKQYTLEVVHRNHTDRKHDEGQPWEVSTRKLGTTSEHLARRSIMSRFLGANQDVKAISVQNVEVVD